MGVAGAAGAVVGAGEEVDVVGLWLSRASRGAARVKEVARMAAMVADVNCMVIIGR